MLVVGLTGGMGSGKTTVSNLFAELGVPVIDTDLIARQLTDPGSELLEEIRIIFTDEVCTQMARWIAWLCGVLYLKTHQHGDGWKHFCIPVFEKWLVRPWHYLMCPIPLS